MSVEHSNRLRGGGLLDLTFSGGMTALHVYAASGFTSASTVALLLGRGANIEASSRSAEKPLAFTVKSARIEMVEVLLAHGAGTTDIISIRDKDRMPSIDKESFRKALRLVQEAHEKRTAEE